MKRLVQSEILDSPEVHPTDVERSLADLGTINRLFGGISTSEKLFRRVISERTLREFSVLDVGSGTGQVPLAVARKLRPAGVSMAITFFDQHQNHLPHLSGDDPLLHTMTGDALHLPFVENWFDIVSCSLFLHHLEPPQAQDFVKQALRVARHAVIINDLVRSPLHWSLLHLWRPFFRARIAYLDGLTSVRRSYTPDDVREMFQDLGRVEITRHYFYRMGIIIWK